MSRADADPPDLTAELLLRAYSIGLFPMAESAEDPTLHWVEPRMRGIFPLDRFHVPKKLARLVRSDVFEVRINRDFNGAVVACAAPAEGREKTWINATIRRLYADLHAMGQAHSVEVYRDGVLAGGLYGVSLGAAFFGESMFHFQRDASKVALVHLVARLIAGGFSLLDAQFITPHLAQFGAIEAPRRAYQKLLASAMERRGDFRVWPEGATGADALSMIAHHARSTSE
ncbi:MAG: leucyl/phenylalanyl-tRNA--protein transferase [Proteobacteria bacterium]|nr:leucyl/phenylalanyl-tRNA--protein transferase [Pseudomonadota bacterium]